MKYSLIDHICRHCGVGRLLESEAGIFKCSSCGKEADKYTKLCFCGHHYPSGATSRVRCIRNPSRTNECPHEVVLMQMEQTEQVQV